MDYNSNFIDNCLVYMRAHNIKNQNLVESSGFSKSVVSDYLNKKRAASFEFVTFFMEKYQISLDEFFETPLDSEALAKSKSMVIGENVYQKYLGR